jgi:hypothetical protein
MLCPPTRFCLQENNLKIKFIPTSLLINMNRGLWCLTPFNNISVLLVEETRVPGENQVTDKLYHIV